MATATQPTIADLIALEPRLARLLARATAIRDEGGDHFCADEAWQGYGAFEGIGLKDDLSRIVGFDRRVFHALLSSSEAYDAACRAILAPLPSCRNCGCL